MSGSIEMRSVMDVAAGDRLIAHYRPRRSWPDLVFLSVWLAFWTIGGALAASAVPNAGPAGGAFLALWLCGWLAGECFSLGEIAWELFGRGTLVVTREHVELRKQVGPFARTLRYDARRVKSVDAVRVPNDEKPRADFCVRITFDDTTLYAGEDMKEHEAENVAAAALARLRPATWWGDDAGATAATTRAPVTLLSFRTFEVEEPTPRKRGVIAATLVACAVGIGALVGLA